MPLSGTPLARGHLRLAPAPTSSRRAGTHAMLVLRALLVAVGVVWISLIAWAGAVLALLPLLWRRAPLGRRIRPRPPREARVIPFQPRRQQALPR